MSTDAKVNAGNEALKAVADWFLEVSALLAVFPWLDQLVFHPRGQFDWPLSVSTTSGAIGLACVGLSILLESRRHRVLIRLTGLVLLLIAVLVFSRR